MSDLYIPDHNGRDMADDLRLLSAKVLTDLLAFNASLTQRMVENKDLLSGYVATAIGEKPRINWGTATDQEVARMGVWQDYCCNLFGHVRPYLLLKIGV